jgi:4'-phosphopantetheinyl transferase
MEVSWLERSTADVPREDTWLSVAEKERCNSFQVPKRWADWRLGRWTAKQAVATYLRMPCNLEVLPRIEIRSAASGAPEVFLDGSPAEVSVSITHSAGIAACAVAPSSMTVGCDLELVEPRSEVFVGDYFTASEQALVRLGSAAQRVVTSTLLWSAKESALKALKVGLRLDTRSVEVRLDKNSHLPNHFFKDAQNPALFGDVLPVAGWHPLAVRRPHGPCLRGWWLSADELMRTIVTVPSSNTPTVCGPLCSYLKVGVAAPCVPA